MGKIPYNSIKHIILNQQRTGKNYYFFRPFSHENISFRNSERYIHIFSLLHSSPVYQELGIVEMFGTQPLGQDFPSPKGESKTRCATSFAVRGHLQKACWWCWLVMAGCHKVDWATNATEFKKKKSLRIQTSSINISFCLNPHSPSQGFTLLSAGICLASPFVTLSTWLACVAAASPLPRPSCSYFHNPVPPPLLVAPTLLCSSWHLAGSWGPSSLEICRRTEAASCPR